MRRRRFCRMGGHRGGSMLLSCAIALAVAAGCSGEIGDPSPSGARPGSGAGPGASGSAGSGATSSGGAGPAGGTGAAAGAGAVTGAGASAGVGTGASAGASSGGAGGSAVVGTELPLRRLSRAQFLGVIRQLVRDLGKKNEIAGEIEEELKNYPSDLMMNIEGERHGGFFRLDQALQQNHADALQRISKVIAVRLTSSPAALGELAGGCATDADPGNDDACLRDFIRRAGRLAHRRPLLPEDEDFYASTLPPGQPLTAEIVAQTLRKIILSPRLLYLVEHGQGDAQPAPLDAHELAARLSLHLWQTYPDEELRAVADSGDLLQESTYDQQVERLINDPRADQMMRELFAQWLRVAELEELDDRKDDVVYKAFADGFVPAGDSREHLMGEIEDLAAYLFRKGGSLQEVMTDQHAFTRTGDLAQIYQLPVWDGSSEPPTFTEPARSGLLTRAAMLASGSANTRPIIKGFRIRNALLCTAVGAPPAAAQMTSVVLSSTQTTREVVEALTEGSGSCPVCHKVSLNPLGFATENFDSLGRFRAKQKLFQLSEDGKSIAQVIEKDVDTQAAPHLTPEDETVAKDAHELTSMILASGQLEECFARQYTRFSLGREEGAQDEPLVQAVREAAASKQPLHQVIRVLVRRPEFKQRFFP